MAGVHDGIQIQDVAAFWNTNPCGHTTSTASERLTYFLEIERYRYGICPYMKDDCQFDRFLGKRVMEIGCGLGTDGAQFAKAGAHYVGVDLTQAAVQLAQENFRLRGLAGEFRQVNAESLPFPSSEFDHVYSFGVIHHSVTPDAIVGEIFRVLKPGGTVTAMLYNRTSINYCIEIMFLRKIGRALLGPAWAPRVLAVALRLPRVKLERHRQLMLRHPRPTGEQWVSMNTDGPDCPLARVYSAPEAQALFTGFVDVRTHVRYFDRSHWPFIGESISENLAQGIGRRFGWHRLVYATKPQRGPC